MDNNHQQIWQYYLDTTMDGKSPGWHLYTQEGSTKLSALTARTALTSPSRTTFHVRSGFFHYEVNLANNTQRNTKTGTIRPIRRLDSISPPSKRQKTSQNTLSLAPFFAGPAGHIWEALLTPLLQSLPDAPTFLAPARQAAIVPPPNLTFQALLPLPPAKWRVIILGQNPYPRQESATGIALFDAACKNWDSSSFGKASTLRNIVKCAAMAHHGISSDTPIDNLRALLREKGTVTPPQWFQSMLAQGVLLLNAALTTGGDGLSNAKHTKFWRPVIECILDEILLAKSALDDDDPHRGVLMLWWGGEALKVKKKLKNVFEKYKGAVPTKHLEWCNPAAQGDKFCDEPNHFVSINQALNNLGQKEVDWLPDQDWLKREGPRSEVFGKFITDTQKLHAMYLERLQSGLECIEFIKPITGIMKQKSCNIVVACQPLGLHGPANQALSAVEHLKQVGDLSSDEKGAVYLYTGNSLYGRLNQALRSADRSKIKCYFPYLQFFIRAHGKIPPCPTTKTLYRGIGKKIDKMYQKGATITWWSVSSCSSNCSVAKGFAGGGTLFHVKAQTAVPIMKLSAFKSEEEYVLAPGTQLKVLNVIPSSNSLTEIFLEELKGERLVS